MKRSSELAGEGTAPKPKKMVGKMKVQGSFNIYSDTPTDYVHGNGTVFIVHCAVRKVKMSLDPPTGCSFSSIPKIKLESVRNRFSNFQSTLSSGWQAVRKIHFAPRVSGNGSFSRQSLAYVQASTQYIKQVSGLLKTGVTTLRSSSSSYDVVQGMCILCQNQRCGTNFIILVKSENLSKLSLLKVLLCAHSFRKSNFENQIYYSLPFIT